MRAIVLILTAVLFIGCNATETGKIAKSTGRDSAGVMPMVLLNAESEWEAGLAVNAFQLYDTVGYGSLVTGVSMTGQEDTFRDKGSKTYSPSLGLFIGWQTVPLIKAHPWTTIQPVAGAAWGFEESEMEPFIGLAGPRIVF